MSVYGTGRLDLNDSLIFLQACLPALSDCPKTLGTVGFQLPYGLQRTFPSVRGSVTPRSQRIPQSEYRNINRFAIRFASRLLLSPRLTLRRLTLLRKPGVFGVNISIFIIVTYAYIFFSSRSSTSHNAPSRLHWNAPLPMIQHHPIASATVLMPAHHPRNAARLVSCYALFE